MTKSNIELLEILLDRVKYDNIKTDKAQENAKIENWKLEEAFWVIGELLTELKKISD